MMSDLWFGPIYAGVLVIAYIAGDLWARKR